jgi:hypothetical protein
MFFHRFAFSALCLLPVISFALGRSALPFGPLEAKHVGQSSTRGRHTRG